jgi:hypothetical protein
MRIYATAILTLAAMLLQLMVPLIPMHVNRSADELNHLIVHSQDIKHHHHIDQSIHLDDSEKSASHFHADVENSSSALVNAEQLQLTTIECSSPAELDPALWSTPSLKGPLRPPKSFA